MRGACVRMVGAMSAKKPRRETPPAKLPVPLCRHEELAMRENRLRQAKAEKSEPRD